MAQELKCGCGHMAEDDLELSTCAECGAVVCLQCAYIDPKTCQMYCTDCSGAKFGVKKKAARHSGRGHKAHSG